MPRRACAVASSLSTGVLAIGLAACAPDQPSLATGGGAGPAGDSYEAGQLVGASDSTLLRAFGPPSQLRREWPAEVWQYSSPECVVDFYLYQVRTAELSVVHLEARSPASRRLPVDSCLRDL